MNNTPIQTPHFFFGDLYKQIYLTNFPQFTHIVDLRTLAKFFPFVGLHITSFRVISSESINISKWLFFIGH